MNSLVRILKPDGVITAQVGSQQILKTNYKNKEVYFLPRHGRGHFISPSNINPEFNNKSYFSLSKVFFCLFSQMCLCIV